MSSAITLSQLSERSNLPGMFIEIKDVGNVGVSRDDFKPIAIMEKLSTGVGETNKIYSVTSEAEAIRLFGKWSAGHFFYNGFVANNRVALDMIPIEIETGGTAASLEFTITAKPSEIGIISFYVFNKFVQVKLDPAVETSIDLTVEKIFKELSGLGGIPVTFSKIGASGSATGIKATSFHSSNIVEKVKWKVDYNDTGATFSFANDVSGLAPNATGGQPYRIVSALDSIGEEIYDFVGIPFYGSSQFTSAKDWVNQRRDANNSVDGQIIVLKKIDYPTTTTWQFGFESEALTVFPDQALNCEAETLGAVIGLISKSALNEGPAIPFQNKELVSIMVDNIFIKERREVLLSHGISTFIKSGKSLLVERVRTLAGETSNQRDLNISLTAVYLRRDFIRRMKVTFPNKTLSSDGNASPSTVTADSMKSFYQGVYDLWVARGFTDRLTPDEIARTIFEAIAGGIKASMPVKIIDQFRKFLGQFGIIK